MAIIRRLLFVILGAILLLAPLLVRTVVWGYNQRSYTPAPIPPVSMAATPAPTTTPAPLTPVTGQVVQEMRPGPVVVDLAHGNRLTRNQFQPLAVALATQGVGLRFWLSAVDLLEMTSFLEFPDQSEDLAVLLKEASALVVVSPFFLWSKQEIALVERFVADGGRLVLISDPDVLGDMAQDINNLAEPFGIVFTDDYLYDTVENDGNYIYIFQNQFLDQAAALEGSTIALYGARSLNGEITPQVLSAATTLSSIRNGVSQLPTIAVGGLAARNTEGRVLALADFDVLTAPFVERHDNARLVDFVARFLAEGRRTDTVADFPAYLGREVALIMGDGAAVDAQLLQEGANLQNNLEATGRTLTLAGTSLLTKTLSGDANGSIDLVVLADYEMVDAETSLLADAGFHLVEELATPAPEAAAMGAPEPTATSTPEINVVIVPGNAPPLTGTVDVTTTMPFTAQDVLLIPPGAPEATATSGPSPMATPSPTPAPMTTFYLQTDDGLRLLATQTVLIVQRTLSEGKRLVAVLGHNNSGIRHGVKRLLTGDYGGCVTSADLAVCSFEDDGDARGVSAGDHAMATPNPAVTVVVPETPVTPPTPGEPSSVKILIVDDDDLVGADETSEADLYLQVLAQMGRQPDLWSTAANGIPTAADLQPYRWVIWSSGGYEAGGPALIDLDAILSYINAGGRLTISSRRPFFGMSTADPSVIADVVIDNAEPALVKDLPTEPIRLPNGLPPVVPLETNPEANGPLVALRRGPDSGSAGAPLLFIATDDEGPEATGARLMIFGMSLLWLPDPHGAQLARNMAEWMLSDPQ
jgi:hypothetical protein